VKKHPRTDGPSLGEVIADSFRDYFAKADRDSGSEVTLSVIDPGRVKAIKEAVDHLSRALTDHLKSAGADALKRIARARARTLHFGGDDDDENSSTLLDLVHFTQELRTEFPEPPIAPACDAVAQAVRAAVVHNVRGKERVHANGLSIFFPADADKLKGDDDESYLALDVARSGCWLPFLSSYATLARELEHQPLLKEIRADGHLVDHERNVTLKCKVADEVDRADFALARKEGARHVVVGRQTTYADDSNKLEDVWTGSWYTLKVGKEEITCPILDWGDKDEDGPTIAEVPVQIRRGGKGNWRHVTLVFNIDDDADEVDGELVRTYSRARARVWELHLKSGDQIRPLHEVIEADGTRKRVPVGRDKFFEVDDPKQIRIGDGELAPGTYQVGYLATDGGGRSEHHFVEVKLGQ